MQLGTLAKIMGPCGGIPCILICAFLGKFLIPSAWEKTKPHKKNEAHTGMKLPDPDIPFVVYRFFLLF
jgi:hypothetical protein